MGRLLGLMLALACTRTPPGASIKAPAPDAGPSFEELLTGAMAELQLKTQAHKAWGLGRLARWDVNQDQGILRFTDPTGPWRRHPCRS
jgi:hypothetical protein